MNIYFLFDIVKTVIYILIIVLSIVLIKNKTKSLKIIVFALLVFNVFMIVLPFIIRCSSSEKSFSITHDGYEIVDKKDTNDFSVIYHKHYENGRMINNSCIIKKDFFGYKIHRSKYDNYTKKIDMSGVQRPDVGKNINYHIQVEGQDNLYIVYYSCFIEELTDYSVNKSGINYVPCYMYITDSLGNVFEYEDDGTGYFWMNDLPEDYQVFMYPNKKDNLINS